MLEVTCSSSFLVKVQSDQGGGSHLHALPVFTQDGLKKFIANKAVEKGQEWNGPWLRYYSVPDDNVDATLAK